MRPASLGFRATGRAGPCPQLRPNDRCHSVVGISAAAAADRDLDFLAGLENAAVRQQRNRPDVLGLGQTHAGIDFGLAGGGEVKAGHLRRRIAFGDHMDGGHVIALDHGVVHRDGERHGIAVLGDLGKLQLDLGIHLRLGAAGQFGNQLVGLGAGGMGRLWG